VGDLVLPNGVEAVADPAVAVVATHAGRAAKPVTATDAPSE